MGSPRSDRIAARGAPSPAFARLDRLAPWAMAAAVLASRLPYLARAHVEVDEYQFGAALDDFDVLADRPHPPGYPLFVMLGRLFRLVLHDPVLSLTVPSALACLLAVLVLARLARRFVGDGRQWLPALLFAANPVVWITSLRALSELPGVAATLLSLELFLAGDERRSRARLVAGAFAGAAAVGIRSASCFLVLPALALVTLPRLGRREWRDALSILVAFTLGNLAWLVPLAIDTGGLRPLLTAMHALGASIYEHDRVVMAEPSLGKLASALHDVWIAPWGVGALGWVVSALAAAGWIALALRDLRAALVLAWLFLPYAFVDTLNLSTTRFRYHVYLVPLVGIAVAALPEAIRHPVVRPLARIALLPLVMVAGVWGYPRARLLHERPTPLAEAVHWLAPRIDPKRVVVHRDDDFRIPLRYLAPAWKTRSLESGTKPAAGRRNVVLSARRDIVAEPLASFAMERGLARLVTIDPPTVYVSEPEVFLGSGWFPLEEAGDRRWRWMGDHASLDVLGGGDPAGTPRDLVLTAASPLADQRLDITACGSPVASIPVAESAQRFRVPLPRACGSAPVAAIELLASRSFVPAERDPASNDRRRLALQIQRLGVEPPPNG
ncbi:MAG: DUF2723 domain-containing protein [bacterium]